MLKNIRLSNIEAISICKKHKIDLIVSMKDEFKLIPNKSYYMVNLENHNQKGSHWVGLYYGKDYIFYFDSYGAPPAQTIINKIKSKVKKIYFNNFICQNLDSILCGWFVITLFMIIRKYKNEKPLDVINKYINYFDDDTELNDEKLKRVYNLLL
jgi:hypothetical protein